MHTFTKEDKEKLDILWSLFQQLKSQVANVFNIVHNQPPQLFPTINNMLDYQFPQNFKTLLQVVDPSEQHTWYWDGNSTASTNGILIMQSNVTTQGRFILLF